MARIHWPGLKAPPAEFRVLLTCCSVDGITRGDWRVCQKLNQTADEKDAAKSKKPLKKVHTKMNLHAAGICNR